MASLTTYLEKDLKLKVNRDKSEDLWDVSSVESSREQKRFDIQLDYRSHAQFTCHPCGDGR